MAKEKHQPLRLNIPKTISQSVYDYLKKVIIDSELKPNQKLNEQEIADIFQVSRTPVREAIAQLAAEGLVEIDPHHGAVVKETSLNKIEEIFQVLRSLDGLAVELVVDRLDTEKIKRLEKMTAKMEHYFHQKDIEKYLNVNMAMHEKIWSYVQNEFLREILESTLLQIRKYSHALSPNLPDSETFTKSMNNHKELMKALKMKDKKKLKTILSKHWFPPLP